MANKYQIVIDLLGSDQGPEAIIEGAKLVLQESENVSLVLVGPQSLIESSGIDLNRVKIIDASETVTNYDNPAEAFYKKPNVSIFKAVQETAKEENVGLISAGNTG